MADEEAAQGEPTPIQGGEYREPVLMRTAFHCPHCGVYAQQTWSYLLASHDPRAFGSTVTNCYRAQCVNCRQMTYWIADEGLPLAIEAEGVMVYPLGSASAPTPHPDFPADARADYEEARAIVDRSPRGAAALLRLALQKLCADLGEPGNNINDDIASLVTKGLDPRVQQAFDALRVIGNNAVHPGQIDLRDDRDTAVSLFGLLNYIVEQQITRPKELQAIYGKLPASALTAIEQRDKNAGP